MKPIDFDAQFQAYMMDWMQNRAGDMKPEEMEARLPDLYLRWLNAPADWLDGRAPGEAFSRDEDPAALTALLATYIAGRVPVPDPLMERIVQLPGAHLPLLHAAADPKSSAQLRTTALNLLKEVELPAEAMDAAIAIVLDEDAPEDVRDVAAELLCGMGAQVAGRVLAAMQGAGAGAAERFLDILCNFPGDERIYTYARDLFLKRPQNRALYASLLGKLGDVRALDALKSVLDSPELTYLDYIEVVNAIERLGGEVESTRDFHGDPYYESMKRIDETATD